MTTRTAEEIKIRHIEKMGVDLGTQFDALWQEVVWVHSKWAEYVELFGKNKERVALLNQAAGTFFRMVQDVLWEETLLHLARLTDPASSGGGKKANLSIRNLPALLPDRMLRARVGELVDSAIEKTDFCRDWRNRRIAHRDLSLALETTAMPLKPASRAQVNEALKSIAAVLNAVDAAYFDSETAFDMGGSSVAGAASLLYVIHDGLKRQAERMERLKRGEYQPDDYPPRI